MKLIDNRYKVNNLIDENSYYSIYEVVDLWDNDKKLSLKLYNTQRCNKIIEYFIENYITFSSLKHENLIQNKKFSIIRMIDHKEVSVKQYYSTYEYIDSPSIDKIYMYLSLKEKLNILLQLCSVLDFLHYRGIVYKHLSPSNIFYSNGTIKLRDIASIYENIINANYDNITRFFIAPEIMFHQDKSINENADKYSLGTLFIYLLTNNFYSVNVNSYEYEHNNEITESQRAFLDDVINKLTNKSPTLRDIQLRNLINDIKKAFNIEYEYDLVKERGMLNFNTKIIGRNKEINRVLDIDNDFIDNCNFKKLILINGNRGVGKTRFLREISLRLQMKGRVVFNTEITKSNNLEFGPISNLLRQTLRSAPINILEKYASEFVDLLPELKIKLYNKINDKDDKGVNKFRLYNRVTNYLEDITKYKEVPMYLIIDNIDVASMEVLLLLDYIIQNISCKNLMFIFSINLNELSKNSEKFDIISRWLNRNYTETIELYNLDLNEIGEFIQNILGINYKPLNFSAVILKESKGNPKLIEYMLKDLYAKGELYFHKNGYWEVKAQKYSEIYFPSTLNEAIKNQIGIIKKEYMSIMKIISSYKNSISKDTLYNMIELDTDVLDRKIQELTTMRLIDEMVSDYGYSYSINDIELKKLIYYTIPKNERIEIHKKIVNLLEEKYKENLDIILEELIYQLISSNQKMKAINLLIEKAKKEKSQFGSKALYLWSEAYEISKDMAIDLKIEILKALGKIYFMKGNSDKAVKMYKELFEEAYKLNNLEYCVAAKLGLAEIYFQKNSIDMAKKEIVESFKLSEKIGYKYGIAKSKTLYCKILLNENKLDELDRKLTEILKYLIDSSFKDVIGSVYNLKGLLEFYKGNIEKAIEHYKYSIKCFQEAGENVNSTKPMNNLAIIHSNYGNYNKAMDYYKTALDIVDKAGIQNLKLTFLNNIGTIYMDKGIYCKAKSYVEESRNIAIEIDNINGRITANVNLSLINLYTYNYNNSYNLFIEIQKDVLNNNNFNVEILSQYYDYLGEFYANFGMWDEARKYSYRAIEMYNEFDEISHLTTEARLMFIDFYSKGIYEKNKFEQIKNKLIKSDYSIFKRKFLIELANIAYVKGDYQFALDILKEDDQFEEKYPLKTLDSMKTIIVNSIINDESSIENLIKLGNDLNSRDLVIEKIYNNISLGKNFYEKGNYYVSFNYICEAIDVLYRIVKSIPDKQFQISFIKMMKVDEIKTKLIDIVEKVFGQKLDFIKDKGFDDISNVDKYFDYSSLLQAIDKVQFVKLVENNPLYKDVSHINDISTLIKNLNGDYKSNLKLILKYLSKETLAQKGYILMYDEENDQYDPIVSLEDSLDFKGNYNLLSLSERYKDGILMTPSLGTNELGLYRSILPEVTKALICIPIRSKISDKLKVERRRQNSYQKSIGYLYLESDRLFNRFDRERHRIANSLISLLYINMDNYKLKLISSIDKLTGVYTRKYFEMEINKIIRESKYNQQSFGLLMIDIDNFKSVNDTYGHRVGDKILSEVGNFLANNVRKTDVVARYGGEEFAIILKNVDLDQALTIGEKLREGIESLKISAINNNITISIGISMFPKHSLFKEELIIMADQALYVAKENRKNRVEVFNPNLTNTLNRVDRLAGILSGNMNSDQMNVLAILDVVNIVKSVEDKEDSIFKFLGRILEILEAENCSLIEIDESIKIKHIYSRSRQKKEWADDSYVNMEIVKRVIKNKRGEFLIDWENDFAKDSLLNKPNWQSVMVIPLIVKNKIKGIVYMTVPIKEKEFDYNSYNLAKILCDIFAFFF